MGGVSQVDFIVGKPQRDQHWGQTPRRGQSDRGIDGDVDGKVAAAIENVTLYPHGLQVQNIFVPRLQILFEIHLFFESKGFIPVLR
jgi:hypothetical protein